MNYPAAPSCLICAVRSKSAAGPGDVAEAGPQWSSVGIGALAIWFAPGLLPMAGDGILRADRICPASDTSMRGVLTGPESRRFRVRRWCSASRVPSPLSNFGAGGAHRAALQLGQIEVVSAASESRSMGWPATFGSGLSTVR